MDKKIVKALKNPCYAVHAVLNRMSPYIKNDEFVVKAGYLLSTHHVLNLKHPKTFNEKLQWLKLHDQHEEYTQMVDKAAAKDYVANIIGDEYIIPTLGVWDKFDDIDFDKLPDKFVLKCTHDSGGLIICKDKSTLDIDKARKRINYCLHKNPYWATREYPYKNVKPRILAEKYMVDESGTELKDYKFFCFDGEPKFIEVDFDRFIGHKRNIYDIEWNLLDFEIKFPSNFNHVIEKPASLDEMINVAKKLSKDIPFVRVDLYSINGQVYFGELTFFHGSGCEKFSPEIWNYKLGGWMDLPVE